jgi:uncharacterized protein YukE
MTAKSYQEKYTIMKPAMRRYSNTMAALFITAASYATALVGTSKGSKQDRLHSLKPTY